MVSELETGTGWSTVRELTEAEATFRVAPRTWAAS
jgi:hypothetical protein